MAYKHKKAMEVKINKTTYVFVPICTFDDLPIEESGVHRSSIIENSFGLRDLFSTRDVYEVVDRKKFMLAKIKYGI